VHFVSTFERTKPYNALPLLPPTARLETEAVLKAAIRASRSLAELKGRTRTVPNPAILLNTIALQEARASSEIENIFTTTDELYRSLNVDSAEISPHAKEVLHYNEALWFGAERLRDSRALTANLAIELVKMLKTDIDGVRAHPGANLMNRATGEVVYTPPDGAKRLRSLLANLEQFINTAEDGLDPLVKLAVLHYQFEAIHPFADGNGRTGRILLILYLLQQRLLEQPILFLSRYIIENKNHYYALLRDVTERGAWEPWILYVLRAVESTAETTVLKIEAIGDLLLAMVEEGRLKLPKRTFFKELIEQLFVRPYCKIRHLEEAGLGNRVSCSRYLHDLADAGLVNKTKAGKEILFINERLVKLLAN
jgi:Fic family protein